MCPPYSHRTVKISDQDVQEQLRDFLEGGPATDAVCERSRLCNECYKCVTDTCPMYLDPMRVNQLLRGLLHDQGVVPISFIPPSDPQSSERIIAAILTTDEEYQRITTPKVKGSGRVLFFAGCNIYYQPNLLLTALDILEQITDDWAYLPGLDHCCGNNHDSAGRLSAGQEAMEELTASLKNAAVETVVVWCPTCAARFHHDGSDLPVISFARFVADNIGGLIKEGGSAGAVTLQEACKVAYLDLDPQAPRELLNMLTNEPVREMPRHGPDTVCCGWSLHQNQPEAGEEDRQKRLTEASSTGAKTLVTVCHGCQWVLDAPDVDPAVRIVNYIHLVGDALGIHHEDKYRKLRKFEDADAIFHFVRGEMGDRFDQLPFDLVRIRKALENMLVSSFGAGV